MNAPRTATPADAAAILALRDAAARWLEGRGIRQWVPGEIPLSAISQQIEAGEWWVVPRGREILAALRLLWSDEQVWGQQPPNAAYVHGLVVGRARSNPGLGRDLLDWAGSQAQAAGRTLLRLDCVETNQALRDYYAGLGFLEVDRLDLPEPWYPCTKLEKHLGPPPRLVSVVLECADLAATAGFYRSLGLTLVAEQHADGPPHFSADLAGVLLELYPGTPAPQRLSLMLPGGPRVVTDPDGRRIEIV